MKNLLLVALLLLSMLGFSQNKDNIVYKDDNPNIISQNKANIVYKDNNPNIISFIEGERNYYLYDLKGKLVKKGRSNEIDISDVSYGIYVLMLEINGNKELVKIYKGEGNPIYRK